MGGHGAVRWLGKRWWFDVPDAQQLHEGGDELRLAKRGEARRLRLQEGLQQAKLAQLPLVTLLAHEMHQLQQLGRAQRLQAQLEHLPEAGGG